MDGAKTIANPRTFAKIVTTSPNFCELFFYQAKDRAINKCPVPFLQSTRRAGSSQKVPDTYLSLIAKFHEVVTDLWRDFAFRWWRCACHRPRSLIPIGMIQRTDRCAHPNVPQHQILNSPGLAVTDPLDKFLQYLRNQRGVVLILQVLDLIGR